MQEPRRKTLVLFFGNANAVITYWLGGLHEDRWSFRNQLSNDAVIRTKFGAEQRRTVHRPKNDWNYLEYLSDMILQTRLLVREELLDRLHTCVLCWLVGRSNAKNEVL